MVHNLLNITTSKEYIPYQMLENKQMLNQLLEQPQDFLKHIRRYSNALTTTMVFGWRTPTYEDPNMKQLFEGFSEFAEINQTGTAALIDFYPILSKLPDFALPAQKKAKMLHKVEKELYLKHWLKAKDEVEKGTIQPCFCEGMAAAQKNEGFADDQAAYISGTLLEAGSDTTSSTLYAFVQAMLLYPEAQKKAQAEIDKVVGDRLPTMDDQANLQYVHACIKETLRWMPTTLLGAVPHAVSRDDEYMGYRIPKGAGVLNNVWAIHMDPNRHPDPRRFNPERYINDTQSLYDSAANADGTKRDTFTFGAGRRICQGMHVAERSLFLGMSRMLWAFDIEPVVDVATGQKLLPDQEKLTQGFVCMPEEYQASIKPRSQAKAELVKKEWHEAETQCLDRRTKQWLRKPDA